MTAQDLSQSAAEARAKGRWAEAINLYEQAAKLEPDGPAKAQADMLKQILDYRCKAIYNP